MNPRPADFATLGISDSLDQSLRELGFIQPTDIQIASIPEILARHDAFIQSAPGTGKTLAYITPMLQLLSKVKECKSKSPHALIACPTQELAKQIEKHLGRVLAQAKLGLRCITVIGGADLEVQGRSLKSCPHIVIGTLGRLADLTRLGYLKLGDLDLLVFDEVDRFFEKNAVEDCSKLLSQLPDTCTRLMVCATIPENLKLKLLPYMRQPTDVSLQITEQASKTIEHWCFFCESRKRIEFVRKFDAAVKPVRCLIFASEAFRAEKCVEELEHHGIEALSVHSGMNKEYRRIALERFTQGSLRYLASTDLLARGLDIKDIDYVLSLDLPENHVIYTHRAGRTGRAGTKGTSVVLADKVELRRASQFAVRGSFVFRCKVLDHGIVQEPTTEEFFRMVEDFR